MQIRVFSYNVHKLFNITGKQYFLPALKEVLSGMELDFVFLQELPGIFPSEYEKDFKNNPLEHLADNLWDHFVYGKNAISFNRNHGNAILSKYPFVHSQNFDISNHRFEERGLLMGKTEIEGRSVVVGCTHLDLTSIGRKRQVDKIKEIVDETCDRDQPMILIGDFNDWDGQTSKQVAKMGFDVSKIDPTFPSFYPMMRLDRVFFRNIKCSSVEVLNDRHWRKLSDHLPICAEFQLEL